MIKFPLCQLHVVCCLVASLPFWPTACTACRCLELSWHDIIGSEHEATIRLLWQCPKGTANPKVPASTLHYNELAEVGVAYQCLTDAGCYTAVMDEACALIPAHPVKLDVKTVPDQIEWPAPILDPAADVRCHLKAKVPYSKLSPYTRIRLNLHQ